MKTQIITKAIIISAILLMAGSRVSSQNAFLFGPDATVPKNDTVVIRLHEFIGDVQWQKSLELNGTDNWENIENATADILEFIADTSSYFRARVVAGHCDPFYSDTTHVNVYNLKDNVVLIDSNELQLISDPDELSEGLYQFIGDQGDIDAGSIIVGYQGGGFLRKVTNIHIVSDTISLETDQGTMDDVFDDFILKDVIVITLDQNKKSMQGGKRIPMMIKNLPLGATYRSGVSGLNFSNTVIYSDPAITFGIEEGSINFEPTIDREFEFGALTGLEKLRLVASGTIESDFDFYAESTQQISYAKSQLIGVFAVPVPVGPIPVVVTLKFYLGFNANMEAGIYATAGYDSDYEVAFGAEYNEEANPKWHSIWDRNGDFISHQPTYSVHGELTAKTYVKPELSVSIAGVAGTSFYVDPYVRFLGRFDYPNPYWHWELGAGIGGYLNFKAELLGYNLVDYTKTLLNWDEIIASGFDYIEPDLPTLSSTPVTNINSNSATCGGIITSDGGSIITARGVVWHTIQNPTLFDNQGFTLDGTGEGEYVSNLLGLSANTTYYVRAYATNSAGTAYGDAIEFVTEITLPTLATVPMTNITANSATSGGIITSDGGSNVNVRGIVWSTNQNPTLFNNAGLTIDGTGIGIYESNLTALNLNTTYYVRAYATNIAGTAYGNEIEFITETTIPTLATTPMTYITSNSATSGGIITSDGGSNVSVRGVVWNTSQNPTLSDNEGSTIDGTGIGIFDSELMGLNPNTTYYVRAYATNNAGTAYGIQIEFTTENAAACGSPVTFTYNGASVTYGTVISADNRCWLDRNLGATQVASSLTDEDGFGDLFQWGRLDDGHQERTSSSTSTLSNSDVPGHDMFIMSSTGLWDWRSPQNNNLWQGVSGTNNPCPDGYRVPTHAEWETERLSWSTNNAAGAFASPLRLPIAGNRNSANGLVEYEGMYGWYWSSTTNGPNSYLLLLNPSSITVGFLERSPGFCVRCIKD